MSALQAKLKTGVANVIKAKSDFDAKVSDAVPSRPTKRKSEAIELSDSDSDIDIVPQFKRRQPAATTSYSAPPPKSLKPWDQDHTNKKLPTKAQSSSAPVATKTVNKKGADLVSLSNQQQRILEVVTEGKNVFFTGSAGVYQDGRTLHFTV